MEEISQMKALQRSAALQKNALPSTLQDAWLRTFGPVGSGIPALRSYRIKRERVETMNVELDRRGCPMVKIEQALDKADLADRNIKAT